MPHRTAGEPGRAAMLDETSLKLVHRVVLRGPSEGRGSVGV